MRDTNAFFTGNLTRDLELTYTPSGYGYARGALAVSRSKKQGDEWVEFTDFIDFTILDTRMAENASESLVKGNRVTISGHIETRPVEQEDGSKRTFWGVIVDDIAVSLRWQTASVFKDNKSKTSGGGAPAGGGDFFAPPNEEAF